MSSFLDRLKKKDVIPSTPEDAKQAKVEAQNNPPAPAAGAPAGPPPEQLKVDIFQTQNAIIVYAQIAGASIHDFSVTIDGDSDTVTIKGQRTRPNGDYFTVPHVEEKEHILEECSWGKFYRQIILPSAVDPTKTEAKMREGVLMLRLPLKETSESGVRIEVSEVK